MNETETSGSLSGSLPRIGQSLIVTGHGPAWNGKLGTVVDIGQYPDGTPRITALVEADGTEYRVRMPLSYVKLQEPESGSKPH